MKVRGRVAVLAVVVTTACTAVACSGGSSGPSTPRAQIQQLLHDANVAVKAKRYSTAVSDLYRALAINPNNEDALFDRALVAQLAGHPRIAIDHYDIVLRLYPAYVPALFNSALLLRASDPARSESLFRRVIAVRPNSPKAYLDLGLLEYHHHQLARAAADLDLALKQDPTLKSSLSKPQLNLVNVTKGAGASHSGTSTATPSP